MAVISATASDRVARSATILWIGFNVGSGQGVCEYVRSGSRIGYCGRLDCRVCCNVSQAKGSMTMSCQTARSATVSGWEMMLASIPGGATESVTVLGLATGLATRLQAAPTV